MQPTQRMQQYYQSVCERQQQALRRNQALQQDVRRVHTSAASGVDTSQLELLKGQYQSSIARTYPHWLAQVKKEYHRQLHTPTTEGYRMPLSVPPHKTVVVSSVTTLVSTTYTTSAPFQGTYMSNTSQVPVTASMSTVPVSTLPSFSIGNSPTQPLPRSKLGINSSTTSSLHGSMQSHSSSRQPDTLATGSAPPLPAKSPVERSSSSVVCEHSHTMHVATEPSTVAVSKMELAEHMSHLKSHLEGEQLHPSTDLSTPVNTNREPLAMKCTAERVPPFPTTSKHAVIHSEQSHSTLPATEPTTILTSNKEMTIHATSPPPTTTQTLTETINVAVTSTTTSSLVASTQLPGNTLLPPTLRKDVINSNLQQQHFSITSTQPRSVLILSQEGSEPSLSSTETPLDLTDDDDNGKEGSKEACNNGIQNMNTGPVAPQERKDHDPVDSDHSDSELHVVQSIDSLLPDNGLHLPIEHAQVVDQTPPDVQAKREQSLVKTKETSRRMGESISREHAMSNRSKDQETVPVVQGEGEVDNPSDRSGDSGGIADLVLPLSPMPQHPQQKLHVNETSVVMDGSSSSTESQTELHKTRDEVLTPLPDPKPQNGADAYATFLQSVCQTSAIDSSPLDSDSDGIDAILTGQQREQENGCNNTSVSSHSATVERPVDEGGGIVTDRGREKHSSISSGSMVHTKRERQDDASDSDSSQSAQAPSYVPTVVEKQSTSQSTLLKKRPGFWGSDDSLDGSDLADSPTTALAEDDKEDFDFHI